MWCIYWRSQLFGSTTAFQVIGSKALTHTHPPHTHACIYFAPKTSGVGIWDADFSSQSALGWTAIPEVAEDDSSEWVSAGHMGDPGGVPSSCPEPGPVCCQNEPMRLRIFLSVCISLFLSSPFKWNENAFLKPSKFKGKKKNYKYHACIDVGITADNNNMALYLPYQVTSHWHEKNRF